MRPPAYQMLADELRDDITSGRLQPGERLPPEPELCVKTGVSRSTVREALRLLSSQHLIITTRGVTGGSFVAHPDAEQLADGLTTGFTLLTQSAGVGLADLLELRRALEVPAAGLAAIRRSEGQPGRDPGGAVRPPSVDDFDMMIVTHAAFHMAVAKATGNPLFELVVRPLYHASYREDHRRPAAGLLGADRHRPPGAHRGHWPGSDAQAATPAPRRGIWITSPER